jgi:hypothetical protein
MAFLANGGLPLRLGFHELDTEERERELTQKCVGSVRTGRLACAFPWVVWARSSPRGSS